MVDNAKEVRKQVFSCIGNIAAALTIVVYLVLCINSTWQFIEASSFVYSVLVIIRTWAPLVVVAITGLEFVSDKSFVIRIIFYVAMALVVIFMFFPDTWTNFVGIVNEKV